MVQIQKDSDMLHDILIQSLGFRKCVLAVILVHILLTYGLQAHLFPNINWFGLARRGGGVMYDLIRIFN